MNKDEALVYARNPANRTIVAIPILLVVSFLFYFLSAFFAYMSGSTATAATSSLEGVSTDSNAAENF